MNLWTTKVLASLVMSLFLALTVVVVPRSSVAEGARQSEYQRHFRRGVQLFRAGDHEGALTEFAWAYRLRQHHDITLNMAYCYVEMDRVSEAIAYFDRFLSEGGSRVPARRREEVQRELERLRALVVEITITVNIEGATVVVDEREMGTAPLDGPLLLRAGALHTIEARMSGFHTARQEVTTTASTIPPPVVLELRRVRASGRLHVASSTPGATVVIDGEAVGPAPHRDEIEAGTYRIEVRAEGYQSASREVAVAVGADQSITIDLTPSGPIARFVVDTGIDGAAVYVDGTQAGTTPFDAPIELSPGPHRVSVEREGYQSWSGDIVVEGGQTTAAQVALASTDGGVPSPVFYSTLGLAAVAGVGALVTGVLTVLRSQELDTFLADVQAGSAEGTNGDIVARHNDLQTSGHALALSTDILWISGSVLAVTALVLGFFTRFGPRDSSAEIQAGGTIIQEGAVITASGRF